ncbi:hypothetical protein D3C72_2278020 [compost metagenome]
MLGAPGGIVALAFPIGEAGLDVVEAQNLNGAGFDDAGRLAGAVAHDIATADLGQRLLAGTVIAQGAAGGGFLA